MTKMVFLPLAIYRQYSSAQKPPTVNRGMADRQRQLYEKDIQLPLSVCLSVVETRKVVSGRHVTAKYVSVFNFDKKAVMSQPV